MNFRYRLMQFMSGRYGVDKFSYGILGFAAVVAFINLIIRSYILQLVVYGIFAYAIFRILSRNISARRKENEWFTEKILILKKRKEFYDRQKADSFHIYKKCPACKAVLRLPRRIGVHTTICPRCNTEFTVKVKK